MKLTDPEIANALWRERRIFRKSDPGRKFKKRAYSGEVIYYRAIDRDDSEKMALTVRDLEADDWEVME